MTDNKEEPGQGDGVSTPSRILWQYCLPLLPFVLLVAVLALGLGRDPSLVPSPFIGKQLPEVAAPKLGEGPQEIVVSSEMKGKVWMLNVWASWCPPCLQEHPQIKWLSSKSIPVVGLNYKDSDLEAGTWLREHGDPYMFSLVDSSGSIGIDLGVYGVPESYVVDVSGKVVHKHVGPILASDAKEILKIATNSGFVAGQ